LPSSERLIADLAGAILDGTPIDWSTAESNVDDIERPLLNQLRLLAAFAELHRQLPHSPTGGADRQKVAADDRIDALDHWGHLRLIERIGGGEFGVVYRAWDTRLDREVALKILRAGSLTGDRRGTSIIEEGRLLARVRHPNVVTIYGAERIEDRIGIWTELVKGCTLQQAIERGRVFSPTDAVDIGIELCKAIAAVHDAGLLHRDIKPHNAMFADDGRVVLMDFGAGRELDDNSCAALAGTPLYLAPELLSGQEPTVRSDIYSVGVVLFHLLTRSYPVRAQTLGELRLAHERRERRDIRVERPDVSAKLARVVARAIDPSPERRYPSASGLGADLASGKARSLFVPIAAGAVILLLVAGVEARRWKTARSDAPVTAGPAGSIVSPVERPAIVVLPFENLSTASDSGHFTEGLGDDIIRNLALVQGLDVRSRTSSAQLGAKPLNLRDVGQRFGANLVLEGSVSRWGNRLRVNAQLIQIAGNVTLWADRFDREVKDIFIIQDEISRAIVNKLRLTLGEGQRRYDINLDAYETYLQAQVLAGRQGFVALKAIELFKQVIARDPSFAPAYAGLVRAYAAAAQNIPGPFRPGPISPAMATMLVRPAAETALQLDPLLAEAHAAMGLLYAREHSWQKAEESFRRAIDLNSSLSSISTDFVSSTLLPLGKVRDADQLLEAALRNDPLSLEVRRAMAELQIIAGRYDEAIDTLQRVEAVDPAFPYVDLHFARALTFAGKLADALPRWERKKEEIGWQHWMAFAYVMANRRELVERMAAAHDHPYRLAMIYAALGDKDRAFEALSRAADIVPERVAILTMYPELASLRGDLRFTSIRRRLGLPPAAFDPMP
jgi:eukaryotic-like serine/threonine-protein kinase